MEFTPDPVAVRAAAARIITSEIEEIRDLPGTDVFEMCEDEMKAIFDAHSGPLQERQDAQDAFVAAVRADMAAALITHSWPGVGASTGPAPIPQREQMTPYMVRWQDKDGGVLTGFTVRGEQELADAFAEVAHRTEVIPSWRPWTGLVPGPESTWRGRDELPPVPGAAAVKAPSPLLAAADGGYLVLECARCGWNDRWHAAWSVDALAAAHTCTGASGA